MVMSMTSSTGPADVAQSRPDAADTALVRRSLRSLAVDRPFQLVRRLADGGSGSTVLLRELGGQRAVLKVTEDPHWHERATRELPVYRDLSPALGDFLPEVLAVSTDRHAVQVLVAAYEPHPSASAVTDQAWVALADQLGRLHATPVPRPAWLRQRPWPSEREVAYAVGQWAGYASTDLRSRAAGQLAAAREKHATPGSVLTHGDCHVGNLVRGPGWPGTVGRLAGRLPEHRSGRPGVPVAARGVRRCAPAA